LTAFDDPAHSRASRRTSNGGGKPGPRVRTSFGLVALLLFGIAVVSRIPALSAPIALDDYAQRGLIEGRLVPARLPWNLYDFIDSDNRAELVDRGIVQWWSDTEGSVTRFLRPIPSLLVWLD
jgi:hypothetical protein